MIIHSLPKLKKFELTIEKRIDEIEIINNEGIILDK
jgi:hypothetical protein